MSSNRTGRSREVITASSNKRLKTDSGRKKRADTEATAPQDSTNRRKKSRSPSASRRSDPFIPTVAIPKTASKKRLHALVDVPVRSRVAEDDDDDDAMTIDSTMKAPSRVGHSSAKTKKENTRTKDGGDAHATSVYSSALAQAEHERQREKLKLEIEALKKQLHEQKKSAKKQSKALQELKAEHDTGLMARRDQEAELASLKVKKQRADEVLSNIEMAMQCQICMELLLKPFALSPCGHVLCLPCLQEWFRKAPPSADDMDIDPQDLDDPHYIMYRQKSCPCCRATVLHRPVPVFLVKSVASAVIKSKGPGHTSGTPVSRDDGTSTVDSDDVWKGLFPTEDDMLDAEEYDEEDDELPYEALPGGMLEQFAPAWMGTIFSSDDEDYDSYASAEDDSMQGDDDEAGREDDDEDSDDSEDDAGQYVVPIWEPPTVRYRGGSRHSSQYVKMRRRGCTREMISNYGMTYTHAEGLVVYVRSLDPNAAWLPFTEADRDQMSQLYVGWNVELDDEDRGGHDFVRGLLENFNDEPGMFVMNIVGNRTRHITKLVRIDELMSEAETTDSEAEHARL
ncbi:hypothetical protein CYLTODRAFT_488369 [Cylindrobasidium torrendii FP15055 ss-10]|uniref:RING-type domain-containing protein n=1 Tax=Cylindrobasidium torrendii FP15055 ss-10 TaxID=1314674 RepID=A0A0D7BIN9_9AGAR|nr:hypothetical protein CYLTODRAFT_488369 [Cylindrobasidium torrendii FP15055 ss-10]